MPRHGLVQPSSLASQDDRRRSIEFDAIVSLLAAFIETVNPVAALLQLFERAADVGDTHHRKIGYSPGRSSCNGFRQPGRSPFRNYDRCGAGRMRGAHDRSQVVRIFDAVQDYVQAAAFGSLFERRIRFDRTKCDDSLMGGTACRAVQLRTRLEAHGDSALPAEIDHLLKTRTSGTLGHHYAIQGKSGPKCLPDGMDSYERGH